MSTDPISEARRLYEDAERQVHNAEQYGEARDLQTAMTVREMRWDALRAAILAADPRRAALETLLRTALERLEFDHEDGCNAVEAWNPRRASCSCRMEKWRADVSEALEETAVEETRS